MPTVDELLEKKRKEVNAIEAKQRREANKKETAERRRKVRMAAAVTAASSLIQTMCEQSQAFSDWLDRLRAESMTQTGDDRHLCVFHEPGNPGGYYGICLTTSNSLSIRTGDEIHLHKHVGPWQVPKASWLKIHAVLVRLWTPEGVIDYLYQTFKVKP